MSGEGQGVSNSLVLNPVITQAGLNEIFTLKGDGLKGIIAQIGLSDAEFTATAALTSLPGEINRWDIIDGEMVSPTQLNIYAEFPYTGDEKFVKGVAIYLSSGTMLAVYSAPVGTVEGFLSERVLLDAFYHLVLEALPADSVTVENTGVRFNPGVRDLMLSLAPEVIKLQLETLQNKEAIEPKLDAAEFGVVSAFQNLTQNAFNQQTMQAGILSCRQYNYHGQVDAMRRVWDRNYNPAGSHNHPNYDRMSGNAETTMITPTGDYLALRHSDYRHKQAIQHDDFLKTEDVPLPAVPASVLNAGDLDAQVIAMRELYQQYADGQFPEGFNFVLTYIETWVEPFTGDVAETFDSFRHHVQIDKAVDQYRLNKVYADTGLKDRFENLPINKVFVAGLEDDGKPILGVLKGRFVCKDLSALGDLRPWLDVVDDPLMDVYRDISGERFSVRESHDRPGKLDEIMALVAGLDGESAYIEEAHKRYGITERIADWGTQNTQNAAYYHRWGSQLSDDASNRRNYQAGFNVPNFWKALTNRAEVLPSEFGGHTYRVSWAMPYEIILYHPVMGWNPHDLPLLPSVPANGDDGGKTEATAFEGIYPNKAWYRTPPEFYTDNSISDLADTGAGVRYVKDRNGIARRVRASGIYIELPEIEGVGKIRQRYPIYHRPQDGSYETSLATAYHRRNLTMTDKLTAEITTILADQISNMGDV